MFTPVGWQPGVMEYKGARDHHSRSMSGGVRNGLAPHLLRAAAPSDTDREFCFMDNHLSRQLDRAIVRIETTTGLKRLFWRIWKRYLERGL